MQDTKIMDINNKNLTLADYMESIHNDISQLNLDQSQKDKLFTINIKIYQQQLRHKNK